MKLYFAPGACSLSPHIVLRESGATFELDQVDNREKKTKSGKDYWTINPKGQVPALQLDSGEMLTEGPVIVQYLADRKPEVGLLPPAGAIGPRLYLAGDYTDPEFPATLEAAARSGTAAARELLATP